jgi:hypothetical protein
LRVEEYLVPQPRLEVAFDFGQIVIGGGAARYELLGVVEEE